LEEACQKLEKEYKAAAEKRAYKDIRHQITNHKIHLSLFKASSKKTIKATSHLKWVTPTELKELPFSSAQGKLREWVLNHLTPQKKNLQLK